MRTLARQPNRREIFKAPAGVRIKTMAMDKLDLAISLAHTRTHTAEIRSVAPLKLATGPNLGAGRMGRRRRVAPGAMNARARAG